MAMTADGKIATANRTVHSFGSPRDLAHLYELRASADAVMCGARTVEISQALLDNGGEKYRRLRRQRGLRDYPVRILVSGSGSIDPAAPIFQKRFSPIIILTTRRASHETLRQLRQLADTVIVSRGQEINFPAALQQLHTKWQINRLLCEGGGELNAALFQADLVNQIHLTLCPKIFGGRTAPTIAEGTGFARLAEATSFKLTSLKRSGDELFTVFQRRNSG